MVKSCSSGWRQNESLNLDRKYKCTQIELDAGNSVSVKFWCSELCILVPGVTCHHFSLSQELYFSIPMCHETAVWCAKIVQSRTLSRSSKRSVSGFLGLGWPLVSKYFSWFVLHGKHQSVLQSAIIMSQKDKILSKRKGAVHKVISCSCFHHLCNLTNERWYENVLGFFFPWPFYLATLQW